jgi:fatty-acyl-CoA synthase
VATPVDAIALQAWLGADRLAAADLTSGQQWSYAALDRDVAACAGVLRARGIGAGDRVAALARNRVTLIVLHHACARIGAIYVPLNWRLAEAELDWLIGDADPALLIHDDDVMRGTRSLAIETLEAAITATDPIETEPINPDATSLILYTSGTSGRPKGAMLSERAIGETAISLALYGGVTQASRFLCDGPMFHVIGIVSTVRTPLMWGGAVLVSDGFQPARTLARFTDRALGISHYFGVPQMAAMLRATAGFDPAMLHGLRGFFTGGAPHASADVMRWVVDGVRVSNGFGMSECGTVCHTPLDPALVAEHAGSVGMPTPRTQARVVDEDERPLPPGTPGDLQIRGDNLFSGYWRRPEATAAAFTVDGWFRTGDVARIDARGFMWIVDRRKDMYISGGENVYPAEIEAAVAGLTGLAEAAVVGVPDDRWGEVGHLAIVTLPGAAITRDAVMAHLDGRLARYKLPRHVSMIDALPRNGAGKVVKTLLRDLLAGAGSRPD